MASSSGSIASGTTEPVMMISPARRRSPKVAAHPLRGARYDPFAGIGLRIRRARTGAAPNDAARQPGRGGAGARRFRATEHHMTLVDVVAQDAFGVLGRRCKIDDLDRR
jgi:hypothetical protein